MTEQTLWQLNDLTWFDSDHHGSTPLLYAPALRAALEAHITALDYSKSMVFDGNNGELNEAQILMISELDAVIEWIKRFLGQGGSA